MMLRCFIQRWPRLGAKPAVSVERSLEQVINIGNAVILPAVTVRYVISFFSLGSLSSLSLCSENKFDKSTLPMMHVNICLCLQLKIDTDTVTQQLSANLICLHMMDTHAWANLHAHLHGERHAHKHTCIYKYRHTDTERTHILLVFVYYSEQLLC